MIWLSRTCIAILLPALFSGGGGGQEIISKPLSGAVRWTLHQHGDLAPVSADLWSTYSMFLGGLRGCTGGRTYWDRHVVCTDEPLPGEGEGQPGRQRTFERLSTELSAFASGGDNYYEASVILSSRLEGRRAAWRRAATDDPWQVTFADDGPKDDWLLERLSIDPEPLGLLPGKPVKVGNRWRIDPETLSKVLFPGGDPRIREVAWDDLDDNLLLGSVVVDLARDAALSGGESAGALWASYQGEVRSIDGRRLAAIDLDLFWELSGVLGERFREMAAPSWDWAPVVFGETCRYDCRLKGDGRLFWDLDSGRFDSLELHCTTETAIEIPLSAEYGGFFLSGTIGIATAGYLDCELALEVLPDE
jgi:hypothetical protein